MHLTDNAVIALANAVQALANAVHGLQVPCDGATKQDLKETEGNIMSAVSDFADRQQASFDALDQKLDAITAGVAALDKLITDFQNSPGALTPADQAALDRIQAASTALVSKAQAINTDAPAPPTPTP